MKTLIILTSIFASVLLTKNIRGSALSSNTLSYDFLPSPGNTPFSSESSNESFKSDNPSEIDICQVPTDTRLAKDDLALILEASKQLDKVCVNNPYILHLIHIFAIARDVRQILDHFNNGRISIQRITTFFQDISTTSIPQKVLNELIEEVQNANKENAKPESNQPKTKKLANRKL